MLAKVRAMTDDAEGPQAGRGDGGAGRSDARRLHGRRHLDGDVAAHRHHLGRERPDLRRPRLRLPADLPQQVRRGGAATVAEYYQRCFDEELPESGEKADSGSEARIARHRPATPATEPKPELKIETVLTKKTPVEIFKRAIGRDPGHRRSGTIFRSGFSGEPPGVAGKRVRLPHAGARPRPPRCRHAARRAPMPWRSACATTTAHPPPSHADRRYGPAGLRCAGAGPRARRWAPAPCRRRRQSGRARSTSVTGVRASSG